MSDRPFIATVGGREVYRSADLGVAQSMAVLQAPAGMETSLHKVRNELTGEEWIGRLDARGGGWVWTAVNQRRPAARARFAAAAARDGLRPRGRDTPERAGAAPSAASAKAQHKPAPALTPAEPPLRRWRADIDG